MADSAPPSAKNAKKSAYSLLSAFFLNAIVK